MTKKYILAPYEAARVRSAPVLRLGLIILALSLVTRFAFFSNPAETVFDEVHFGKFVSGYFTGEYFFDIHPPLGKLLIAGMAKISGFEPGFSFKDIGQKFPDASYKWLRFLPKLAGALLPAVIFLIALELGLSQKFAFLAGLLLVFENSLIVQSRFILIDAFLLLFGFLGILFYLKSKTLIHNSKFLILAGIFSALAGSVKWTGFSFLALILLFYFWRWFKSREKLKLTIYGLMFLIIVPFLIYFSIFAIHFSLLDKPGPGLAFHPPNFQEMNIFSKFTNLNIELYQSNARLNAPHPYSSQWYTWPLMIRPLYYWNNPTSLTMSSSKIYFLGNPLIYWLSTIAVIYFTINFFRNRKNLNYSSRFASGESKSGLMAAGYWLNLLPFIFIGRVMFLYHYLTSLIFASLILAYVLDRLRQHNPEAEPPVRYGARKIAFNAILIGSIILFLFFSPLTYGLEIPDWYYNLLIWLPTWG